MKKSIFDNDFMKCFNLFNTSEIKNLNIKNF